jgi:hypothetical protein
MAVLALNQQQKLNGNQFVATFTGVGYDDELIVSFGGNDVVFNESSNLPYLRPQSRTNTEARVLVLTGLVPEGVDAFSFRIHAAYPTARAWILNDATGETYQNYATIIEIGKTVELLEFTRGCDGWLISTKYLAIGEVPLPAEQSQYPEHIRDLAIASRGINPGGWKHVQGFVEVNEITQPNLLSQLYLDSLAAMQGLAASVKLSPLTVTYGEFGETSVAIEARVDEAHRAQVKALTASGYASATPTADQLRTQIARLAPGGVLVALVNTLGGFDVASTLETLEAKDSTLLLLSMRKEIFGVPTYGGSMRVRAFDIAELGTPGAKSVVDALR